jgi:hypothetical protein
LKPVQDSVPSAAQEPPAPVIIADSSDEPPDETSEP